MTLSTAARSLTVLPLIALLAVTACGDGGTTTPTDPDEPGDPDGTLECEIVGYPCAWANVPIEVIESSLALAYDGLSRMGQGASASEVAAWLEGQAGVVETQHGAGIARFRLEGGRGVWISPEGSAGTATSRQGRSIGTGSHPTFAANPAGSPARIVAGDSEEKRALVLSPYLWLHDAETIVAPEIAAMLSATRGYEGRVELHTNETVLQSISLEHFRRWSDYQAVALVSGLGVVCKAGSCRSEIGGGLVPGFGVMDDDERHELIHALAVKGVELSVSGVEEPFRADYQLTTDFFVDAYPGGLGETVLVVGSDILAAEHSELLGVFLAGGRSVVIGWDDSPFYKESIPSIRELWTNLAQRGYPARVALEELGDLRTTQAGFEGEVATLGMGGPTDGTDLRIRDVVTVLNPTTGTELASSDAVAAVGIANDGQADAAPFRVRVDGVTADHAADVSVIVTVDGVAAEPIPLADGSEKDEGAWEVEGTVQLPYDLTEDRTMVWDAVAVLHDGGESRHERTATLSGAEPLFGTTWEMTARHTTHWIGYSTPYHATTTVLLTFEPGQDPMDPQPNYAITAGTFSWDYSHSTSSCTVSAPALTFDLEEANLFSERITFDATQTPATVTGWLRTQTPWVTVSSACEENTYTREHRDTHIWFEVAPGDPPQVVQDGELIRGTRCFVQHHTNNTTFVTRSDYVMRRLRPGDESPPPPLHEGTCV